MSHARDLSSVATLVGLYDQDGRLCECTELVATFLALHLHKCAPAQLSMLLSRVSEKNAEDNGNSKLLLCRDTCAEWQCDEETGLRFRKEASAKQCLDFSETCVPMTDVVSWITLTECLEMPCDIVKDTLHINVRLPLMRSFVKQTKCREDTLGVHHTQDLCRLYLVKALAPTSVLRRVSQHITNGSLALAEWVTQPIEQISDRVYRSIDAAEALASECVALAALMRVRTHNEHMQRIVFDAAARAMQLSVVSTQSRQHRNTCIVQSRGANTDGWSGFLQLVVARKYPATLSLLLYYCVNIEQEHKSKACVLRYSMEENENTQFNEFRQRSQRIDTKQWSIICTHVGSVAHLKGNKAYRTASEWLQQMPVLCALQACCGEALPPEATALAYLCLYQREWRALWQEATHTGYRLPYLSEALEDTLLSWRRKHQLDMFTMDRLQAIILVIEYAQ